MALLLIQRTLGREHPDALTSFASTYGSLGQLKEAAKLHEKILEVRQRTLRMEHPDALSSMNNLAETYQSLGQMKEAAEPGGNADNIGNGVSKYID